MWFRLDTDDEDDDNTVQCQPDDSAGNSSVYDLDWTRLPHSPLGRDGPAPVPGPPQCRPGGFSLDGFGGFCMFGLREVQPTNCQDLATRRRARNHSAQQCCSSSNLPPGGRDPRRTPTSDGKPPFSAAVIVSVVAWRAWRSVCTVPWCPEPARSSFRHSSTVLGRGGAVR